LKEIGREKNGILQKMDLTINKDALINHSTVVYFELLS